MASESDASAFTEIKIQSVVLQFLIDNAYEIFSDNVSSDWDGNSLRSGTENVGSAQICQPYVHCTTFVRRTKWVKKV